MITKRTRIIAVNDSVCRIVCNRAVNTEAVVNEEFLLAVGLYAPIGSMQVFVHFGHVASVGYSTDVTCYMLHLFYMLYVHLSIYIQLNYTSIFVK